MQMIRSVARLLLVKFRQILQVLRWNEQYRYVLKGEEKRDYPSIESLGLKKVLILAPHADDELIGCSTILMNESIKTDVLYFQLYGYDTSEKNMKVRDDEIKICSKILGFTLFMDINDKISFINKLIGEKEYDAIFIPSPFDWHWEHRQVFSTFATSLSLISSYDSGLYYYSVSVPLKRERTIYKYVLGNKGQKEKWNSFQNIYKSQKMPITRYCLQEKLNCYGVAAELFLQVNSDRINKDLVAFKDPNFIIKLNNLKDFINHIQKIREWR